MTRTNGSGCPSPDSWATRASGQCGDGGWRGRDSGELSSGCATASDRPAHGTTRSSPSLATAHGVGRADGRASGGAGHRVPGDCRRRARPAGRAPRLRSTWPRRARRGPSASASTRSRSRSATPTASWSAISIGAGRSGSAARIAPRPAWRSSTPGWARRRAARSGWR